MGLKLQSSCNLLTTLLKQNHNAGILISLSRVTQINLNKLLKLVTFTSFVEFQGSMDRLLDRQNKELFRSTILRQEEIFQDQVRELHRLYRVQKMLMAELRTREAGLHFSTAATIPRPMTDAKNKYWSSTSTSETSHSSHVSNRNHAAIQFKAEHNSLHQCGSMPDETFAKLRGFDLEQPVNASRVQSHELWAAEENELELTLSIGGSSSGKKPKHWLHPEPRSKTKQLLLSKTGARPEGGDDECNERDSLQKPPWLFQTLS